MAIKSSPRITVLFYERKKMPKQKSATPKDRPEILSPKDDNVFRMFFAPRPDLLKSLLQSVIRLPDDEFEEIVVVDPHVYPDHPDWKYGVLDIKIRVRSKKILEVEMQKEKLTHLRERVVFYTSGMIREQAISGGKYENIQRVISVIITNHPVIAGDDAYHHRYTLYDPETRSEFTDLIEIHILELPKLPKAEDGSDLWNWMKFLTAKTKKELEMIAEKSPTLEKAAKSLLEVSEDEVARYRLERMRLAANDERLRREEARAEGMEKGIEKVFSLLKKGVSIEEAEKIMTRQKQRMN
jgi:predicted transposase/invertase (TIGR01784 family)